MRVQSCTFVYTNSTDLVKGIFEKMDAYENVTRLHDEGSGYPREYFDITLGENVTYRIMLQSNGYSYFYVCPCAPTASGGSYTARLQVNFPSTVNTQENTPDGRNVTFMKFLTDDVGNFLGFSMPYANSRDNPHFWLVTPDNVDGFPVLIESNNGNAYKLVDTPTNIGTMVQSYDLPHESNETLYLEQVICTAGTGSGLKDLWCVANNSFYHTSQASNAFLYVNTDQGQFLKLRNYIWAEITYVNPDETIYCEVA